MDRKIKALACVLAWSGVAQADWMFLPVQGAVGTLAHLETGWVLNVDAEEDHWEKGFTNLTVTGVTTVPAAPCLLPLGDTLPSGLSIVAIADRNGYGGAVFELVCASLTALEEDWTS